ncbi:hypothetical protein Pmani_039089 [Petrolisthes manimaculis]|uniref:Protein FAN n=1 Tax=Petrolisthes manimaculis TaxID=1843537 RepID=A0AAE1TLN7_9EUCA|nr:hypothetical protein Pmani_039089 [Petrolisthes manimaculis]
MERFSLLLLEPGEIYFEDYAAIYTLPVPENQDCEGWHIKFEDGYLRGRLKVCSKSLVFDPRDLRAPIIKFPFRAMETIVEGQATSSHPAIGNGDGKMVEVRTNLTVEMLEGGVLQPYTFCRKSHTHVFQLVYCGVDSVLPQACQLHRAATLPPNDQNTMIQAIIRSRQSRQKFDRTLLGDLAETEVLETKAFQVTPLVTNPGTILLTTSTLYFQPHNNVEKHPVIRIGLPEVRQVIKRRYLLRQVGLEVYCREHCMVKHLLLIFKECSQRDQVHDLLMAQEKLSTEDLKQDNATYQWQARAISNYDYLCYLNSQADRSENDLTQYPVFPWVLADYVSETLDLEDPGTYRDLSKPVGALNTERLSRLKERCKDMPEPRFLYGSHYSTPGFVLFYLVRLYPQYMLCLQNGRFDHPDRMFNSLQETWCNVTTNPSDFKELIPEFYNLNGSHHFLTNTLNINFGTRQNGKPVGDVELPPWASDSKSMIQVMRDALESEYVSANLHHWIDLIFGYKQRGEEAEKADNLFYHLCYEGAVDLAAVTDLNERLALEVQITEFGQVPKQIFSRPHQPRARCLGLYHSAQFSSSVQEDENGELARQSADSLWGHLRELQELAEGCVHKDTVLGVTFTSNSLQVVSVGQDSLAKVLSLPTLEQVRSVRVGTMAVSQCQHLPATQTILLASWDNNVYRYSMEYGQVSCVLQAHSDAVSCLKWCRDMLVTGSWDCTVRVWKLEETQASERGGHVSASESVVCEMDHDAPVTCLDLHPAGSLLATGTQDGSVSLWLLPTPDLQHHLTCHSDTVSGLAWNSREGEESRLLTAGRDGCLTIFDPNLGTTVCIHKTNHIIRCVAWEGRLVAAGVEAGDLILFDMGTGQELSRLHAHIGAVTCLAVSPDQQHLVTGGMDKRVKLWGLQL